MIAVTAFLCCQGSIVFRNLCTQFTVFLQTSITTGVLVCVLVCVCWCVCWSGSRLVGLVNSVSRS